MRTIDANPGLQLTPASGAPIVTVAEAKERLRVETTDDDARIGALIDAVQQQAEDMTGRLLAERACKLTLNGFPHVILLQRAPVSNVDSIQYTDDEGNPQTLAANLYQFDTLAVPAQVAPAYGETWPAHRRQFGAVIVNYTAGYADGQAPPTAKQAVLEIVAAYYNAGCEPPALTEQLSHLLDGLVIDGAR